MHTTILGVLARDERAARALFGLGKEKLDELGRDMGRLWGRELGKRKGRKRTVGGGRRGQVPGGRQKAAFALFYLKAYPSFDVLSAVSGTNRGECCRWVHKLMPILEEALGHKLMLPKRKIRSAEEFYAAFPQAREVVLDGMERQRPGKKSSDRRHFSGKRKRHMQKAIVGTQGRRIGCLGPSKRGARHDKRLLDKAHLTPSMPPNVGVLLDSGFQGVRHPGRASRTRRRRNGRSPVSKGGGTRSSPACAWASSTPSAA